MDASVDLIGPTKGFMDRIGLASSVEVTDEFYWNTGRDLPGDRRKAHRALQVLCLWVAALLATPESVRALQAPEAPSPLSTSGTPVMTGTTPSLTSSAAKSNTNFPSAATSRLPAGSDHLIFSSVAYCGSDTSPKSVCRFGDTLFVGFTNLREWMEVSTNQVSKVTLVLNGRVMSGLTSRGPDQSYRGLAFDLRRLEGNQVFDQENRDAWNVIVSELRVDPNLHIGVASGGNPPFWGSANVIFKVFPNYTWAVIIFLLALLLLFLTLARKSDILRDAPSEKDRPKKSYSLARCQMAWWFFLIAASYCYILLTLGSHESLTAGALILTGVSAGTGLASSLIDGSKREQRETLTKEQSLLTSHISTLQAAIFTGSDTTATSTLKAEQGQETTRLATVQNSLASLPSPTGPSEGLLSDILRDESGVSFHRFQMVAWTIILGFVFVTAVYRNLTMPDFSATLLGLMGISSGTYIGFKISDPLK